jgi:hypothetical protein
MQNVQHVDTHVGCMVDSSFPETVLLYDLRLPVIVRASTRIIFSFSGMPEESSGVSELDDDEEDDRRSVAGYEGGLASLGGLRGVRGMSKRNYNLDHLARMNFRRSFRAASSLNNRHILGGL